MRKAATRHTTEVDVSDSPAEGEWRVLGERSLYKSPWVELSLTEVELPSGRHFEHHTIRMPAAAVSVVLDPSEEHVLLSWRHRFVADVWNYELPGGLVEEGEDPKETARREILEETGHEVDSIEEIATFEPMIGMVSSPHHVFLARGARLTTEPTEQDEGRFSWVPIAETQALITEGRVRNSGTLVGLLALALTLA